MQLAFESDSVIVEQIEKLDNRLTKIMEQLTHNYYSN
jgi:hypothetical protein